MSIERVFLPMQWKHALCREEKLTHAKIMERRNIVEKVLQHNGVCLDAQIGEKLLSQ